eukprot:SAG31_NODE_2000_length_6694_cov_13.828658_4_plen_158_part_00
MWGRESSLLRFRLVGMPNAATLPSAEGARLAHVATLNTHSQTVTTKAAMPTSSLALAVLLGATNVVTAAPRAAAPQLEKMTLANFVHERVRPSLSCLLSFLCRALSLFRASLFLLLCLCYLSLNGNGVAASSAMWMALDLSKFSTWAHAVRSFAVGA